MILCYPHLHIIKDISLLTNKLVGFGHNDILKKKHRVYDSLAAGPFPSLAKCLLQSLHLMTTYMPFMAVLQIHFFHEYFIISENISRNWWPAFYTCNPSLQPYVVYLKCYYACQLLPFFHYSALSFLPDGKMNYKSSSGLSAPPSPRPP